MTIRGTFGRLVPGKPLVNVVAKNRGWLFEDLKDHFLAGARRLELGVACSDEPWPSADAWIYLRTHEAASSPELARTVIQIHDMFADDYGPGGPRRWAGRCGAVILTHPVQREILAAGGIVPKVVMCQPVGSAGAFSPANRPSAEFTIGWVGRPMSYRGVDLKRCEMAAKILGLAPGRSLLVGQDLGSMAQSIWSHPAELIKRPPAKHSDYPSLYRRMDALLITSLSEAGPLCLFEALASGVPVVSTRVGWASRMIEDGVNGYLYDTIPEAVERLSHIHGDVEQWRSRRPEIAATQPHRLEHWVDANLRLALELVR